MAGVSITQLDPHGVSGRRYGSFAGKPAGGGGDPVGKITQLCPHALSGRRYGSFAGKAAGGGGAHPVGILTQLCPHTLPGQRYGTFVGKSAGGVAGGDEERVRPPASFHALRHVTVLPPKFWRETA